MSEIKPSVPDDPVTSREVALRLIVEELQKQNNDLRELLVQAGYIVTQFDGHIGIFRDPLPKSKDSQP